MSWTLTTNTYLPLGLDFMGESKLYSAGLQKDGTFAVRESGTTTNDRVWDSGVHGEEGDYFAVMQSDGNFVVYPGSDPAHKDGDAIWSTCLTGGDGPFYATIRGDGTFAIFKGNGPADNQGLVWDSGKFLLKDHGELLAGDHLLSPDGKSVAKMQADGNLCIYNGNSQNAVWCSGATGSSGHDYRLEFVKVVGFDKNSKPDLLPNGKLGVADRSIITLPTNPTFGTGTPDGSVESPKVAYIWDSKVTKEGEDFFATLGNDSVLSVYEGTPGNQKEIWKSGQ